jgi:hypothetical protein
MLAMAARLELLLQHAETASGSLTFAVIVPGWLDDAGVQMLDRCVELRCLPI